MLTYDDTAHPTRPPMLLLHGWCGERAEMTGLAAAFATSHRVIRIDLPGHGGSRALDAEAAYTVPAQAAAIADLADALGVRDAVVVGHSLGGTIGTALAADRPDLVAAVVALEAPMLVPDEVNAQVEPILAALRTPAWRDAIGGFFAATPLPTDDPDGLAELLARIGDMPQHVVAACGDAVARWDAEPAVAELGARGTPLLYVEATGGLCDLDRLGKLCPQLTTGRLVGVGHDQMLRTPAQVAAVIERFLATALGRTPVDNAAPVHALFAAIASGDLDAVDGLVSADFVDHGAPPALGIAPGPNGYKTVLGLLRAALDMHWEPIDVVAAGERVAVRNRNHGRHVADFMGFPATGREFAFEAMHVFRVEDGIIREHWAVRDDLALFVQLGLLAPPVP